MNRYFTKKTYRWQINLVEKERSTLWFFAAAAAKSLQSCPTLCDPRDSSPPGSPVSGILQARTLEWVAISFSKAWKWKVKAKSFSLVRPLVTPWTAAYQAPPSMGFSRQGHWSGVPVPSPLVTVGNRYPCHTHMGVQAMSPCSCLSSSCLLLFSSLTSCKSRKPSTLLVQ